MEKKYNKLVRDNIPEIIASKGGEPITRILSDEEYKLELEKKLYEEYNEVLSADNPQDRIEELADMIEVISALAELENHDLNNVISVAKIKKMKRGGFKKRIFLESVNE